MVHFWTFLVEKLNILIFDQTSISDLQSAFLVEKVNFQFLDQKSNFDHLKCIWDIYGRKTNFQFFHQKSISDLWGAF